MEAASMPPVCPQCGNPVSPDSFFCPQCGKELRAAPLSVSLGAQVWIYALSIFLPPLGLWPGIKYVKRSSEKEKLVGWIAIVLTVISTVVTTWLTFAFLNVYLTTLTQSLGGIQ